MKEDIKCYCGHTTYCDCSPLEQPKQETLEEVAEKIAESCKLDRHEIEPFINGFLECAKWNQERSYSEKEFAIDFAEWCDDNYFRIGTTSFWAESLFDEKAIAYKTEELLKIYESNTKI